MKHPLELSHHQLRRICDFSAFRFTTTEEVPGIKGMLGQQRAEEAMEFGLGIQHNSYHIYISGSNGTGRTTYAKSIVEELSREKPVPDDWCYVYSFDQPDEAVALNLPAGRGRQFQKDMNEMIEEIILQVTRAFNSEDYDRQRNEISKIYQEEKNKLINYLTAFAREKNYMIKGTSTGFVFKLIDKDREVTDEEYESLEESEKKRLEEQLLEIQETAMEVIIKIKNIERLAKKRLLQLEMKVGLFIVNPIMKDLIEAYSDCEKVVAHLKRVQEDIVENIYQFVLDEEEALNPLEKIEGEGFLKKYQVNLFIDNSQTEGAPVIMEYNPTLNRLTGSIEYIANNGVLKSNFLKIKPGAIHLANGGYLILEAKKLLTNPYSWETLKRILQTNEITVENMGNQIGIIDAVSLKLEPIPIHLKVILIGSEYLYYLLYHHDEDFDKYFKVLVDFNHETERNADTEYRIAQFVNSYTQTKGIRPLDRQSMGALVDYSSRLVGNQNKLSTRFDKMIEILVEANYWAGIDNSPTVGLQHIEKAIAHKRYRVSKQREKISEGFENQKILIDIKGQKIGVINGLSVISVGDNQFGKPGVITVTTSAGREGIINIEREAQLSGEIYDKGVMILTGFLMEKFGQNKTLALSARICFEQSYGGIDGDSASSAELYALLSSISGIPIRQYIAATGSINQKGYIQPVGGVTEKIEGFFEVCQSRGLTGKQGVLIPYQNIDNLMLAREVVEAVEAGIFHIYAIKHVNEGLEIVMGQYHEKIYARVNEKLAYYQQIAESLK